jgi:hypothetical protein
MRVKALEVDLPIVPSGKRGTRCVVMYVEEAVAKNEEIRRTVEPQIESLFPSSGETIMWMYTDEQGTDVFVGHPDATPHLYRLHGLIVRSQNWVSHDLLID